MAIIAIDQGTSGTKALVLDGNKIISQGAAHVDVKHLADGRVECDPEEIWQSIISCVSQALPQEVLSKYPIEAVSLANQGESILSWDQKSLQPKSPVIVWQDARAGFLCDERKEFNNYIREISGLENDPYFVAPKLRWLADNSPNDVVITTLDTWLIAKFTGEFVTDISTASRSMLLNLKTGAWDSELLSIWKLENHHLPKILNNDEIVGEINSPELPFLKGIPLAGIIVDQAAALLAENCLEKGEAKCTYGTGAFLLSNIGDKAIISQNRLSTSFAWKIQNSQRYYEDGQVFTAASAVDWLIKNQILNSIEEIDSLPMNTNGVHALPGFAGYGAPRWQPQGKAMITGLSLGSSREEIARAVLNGIAAQVTELIQVMGRDGAAIKKIRVDGGLTKSKTLMQFQADIAQVELEVFPHPDATAVGAGILGRLALNKSGSLADTIPVVHSDISYYPQWSKDQAESFMNEWVSSNGSVKS